MGARLRGAILAWRRANTSPATRRDIYDNPATPEAHLIGAGIINMLDFAAATARPTKSPALLGVIIDFALHGSYLDFEETKAAMLTLLSEPGLTGAHLLSMTRSMRGRALRSNDLLFGICGHGLADVDVITAALWNTNPATTTLVATHTGTLLPAAIGWFRVNRVTATGYGYPVADWHRQITELTAEWTTWASDDPARTAFLTHRWSDFATTDEMFAAGAALAAAPAGPQ